MLVIFIGKWAQPDRGLRFILGKFGKTLFGFPNFVSQTNRHPAEQFQMQGAILGEGNPAGSGLFYYTKMFLQ